MPYNKFCSALGRVNSTYRSQKSGFPAPEQGPSCLMKAPSMSCRAFPTSHANLSFETSSRSPIHVPFDAPRYFDLFSHCKCKRHVIQGCSLRV